jgi:tetratricopeptide (TPR) repeat protein
MNLWLKCVFGALCLFICNSSEAAYTVKGGRLISVHELATMSVQEHYSLARDAFERNDWRELVKQARIVARNFPSTPFALDSYFYLGVAYYHLQEFDFSNENLTLYLKKENSPKFFEEAVYHKFLIAEAFAGGAKKRLLGQEDLPKWLSAKGDAVSLYDEVVAALPQHDLAVKALFGKAAVLFYQEDFKGSIETYQTLIRRFHKHPLARDSYVAITKVYRVQADKEYADPDYLDLAEINIKKFKVEFPRDPKIAEAESLFAQMLEVYAEDLYVTAQFYERTKKPKASIIYYSKIVSKYPQTEIAERSQKRLDVLLVKNPVEPKPPVVAPLQHGVIVDASSENSVE